MPPLPRLRRIALRVRSNSNSQSGLQQGFSELQRGYAGLAGDYIEFARRRDQASAESRDFVFMLMRDEDRSVALAQVSKLSGEVLGAIDLGRDKEPLYQIDDIANRIFYQASDTVIEGYRFTSAVNAVASTGP